MTIVESGSGLRELKTLAPNSELLDTAVVGFRARRQTGPAITFSLVYRNAAGGTASGHDWTMGFALDARQGANGGPAACSAKSPLASIRRSDKRDRRTRY